MPTPQKAYEQTFYHMLLSYDDFIHFHRKYFYKSTLFFDLFVNRSYINRCVIFHTLVLCTFYMTLRSTRLYFIANHFVKQWLKSPVSTACGKLLGVILKTTSREKCCKKKAIFSDCFSKIRVLYVLFNGNST